MNYINITNFVLIIQDRTYVSACFFKTKIFAISFSNAKWIYISLESLMIELHLHLKIYLDYFPGRLKYTELEKLTRLTF